MADETTLGIRLEDLDIADVSNTDMSIDDLLIDLQNENKSTAISETQDDVAGMTAINAVEAAKDLAPTVSEDDIIAKINRGDFLDRLQSADQDRNIAEAETELNRVVTNNIISGQSDVSAIAAAKDVVDKAYLTPGSVTGAAANRNASDPWAAWEAVEKQEMDKIGRQVLEAKALGQDTSELERQWATLKNPELMDPALKTPLYDPIDLMVDIGTFGGRTLVTKGIKGLSQVGAKAVAKETTADVAFGMLAGGFMSVADAKGAGPVLQTVSGIIGPIATASLTTLTRRGLAEWLKRVHSSNREVYNSILKAASGDDKFSITVRRIAEDKFSSATGQLEYGTSQLATVAKVADGAEDKGLQDAVVRAITGAQTQPNNPLGSAAKAASGAGDSIGYIGILKGDIVSDTASDIGKELHNATVLSDTVGPRVLWDSVSKVQEKVVGRLKSLNIYNGQWDMGTSDLGWERGRNAFMAWITSPTTILKNKSKDLVANPTFLDQQAARISREFNDGLKDILKPLSKNQRKRLGAVFDQINQTGTQPVVTKGGLDFNGNFVKMSPKELDSFFATRILLDESYRLTNRAAVSQARRQGLKWDSVLEAPVRIKQGVEYGTRGSDGVEWTADLRKRGAVWAENIETREGRVIHPDKSGQIVEIADNAPLIKYEKDYIPIIYKDDWRVLAVKVHNNGRVESTPVATAPTEKESRAAIEQLNMKRDKATEDPDVAVHYMAMRKGDDLTTSLFEDALINPLHELTPSQLHQLQKTLEESGIDAQSVRDLVESVRQFSYKKNSHLLERGKGRLKGADLRGPAPMVPSLNAIAQYLQVSSSYIAKADYNALMRDKFLNTFGELLAHKHNWQSDVLTVDSLGRPFDPLFVKEAKEIQDQLRIIMGTKSKTELSQEAYIDGLADRARAMGMDKIGQIIDKSPVKSLQGAASVAKQVTASAKLGMYNFAQLIVQSTAVLNTIGKFALYSPTDTIFKGKNPAMQGARDFMKHVLPATEEGNYLNKLYRESGFGSVVGYANIDDTVRSIRGERSPFGRFIDANTIAFRAGEGIQRGVAWFAERRALIDQIIKGKHPVLRQADIDTPAFIKAVSDNANNTALNMSKYNQPRFARGLMGIPFQFMQFATHQAELMLPGIGKMSMKEKAGIWAAWAGAFGMSGVPFLMDATMLGETVAELTGHPEAVGATDRFAAELASDLGVNKDLLKKGLANNDVVDLTHRVALGYMLQSYYDGVDVSDFAGAAGSVLTKTIHGTIQSAGDLYGVLTEKQEFSPDMLARPVQEISGLYNPYAAAKAAITGELRDRKNKLIKEEPDLVEIISTAIGVQPLSVTKQQERKGLNIRINKAWRDWAKDRASKIAEIALTDPDFADKMMMDCLAQIEQYNPTKVNEFAQQFTWEYNARLIPEDLRNEFMSIRNQYQLPEE